MTQLAIIVFIFVEYSSEDGRKRSKHVGDLPHVCILLYLIRVQLLEYTGWCTKCHTIDCARNTFLLLQKHFTSGTELILIGRKIVPNEEHVQCDHRFASQPLANEPLHSSQLFDTTLQRRLENGGPKM